MASCFSFNSRLVRLIGRSRLISISIVIMFQFQIGSIDSVPAGVVIFGPDKFQFQIGSIDSLFMFATGGDLNLFQFQIGSIDRAVFASPRCS